MSLFTHPRPLTLRSFRGQATPRKLVYAERWHFTVNKGGSYPMVSRMSDVMFDRPRNSRRYQVSPPHLAYLNAPPSARPRTCSRILNPQPHAVHGFKDERPIRFE